MEDMWRLVHRLSFFPLTNTLGGQGLRVPGSAGPGDLMARQWALHPSHPAPAPPQKTTAVLSTGAALKCPAWPGARMRWQTAAWRERAQAPGQRAVTRRDVRALWMGCWLRIGSWGTQAQERCLKPDGDKEPAKPPG